MFARCYIVTSLFPGGSVVKTLPAVQESWVRSLSWADPLEEGMEENSMDRAAWRATVHGVAKSRTRLSDFTFHFSLLCTGEGNGNLLQCSCLENPRDRGAWWAAVHGVAQSWTPLKQLSSSRQHIKKQRRYSANKGPSSQGYGCSSSHVWM